MSDNHETPNYRRRRLPKPLRIVRGHPRLAVSAAIGVIVGLFLPGEMRDVTRALIAWNITVLVYLVLSAVMMARSTQEAIRRQARFRDEGRLFILVLACFIACASIAAIVVELGPVKNMVGVAKALHLGLTVLTVLDSWTFLHMIFTFHYAHEFYTEMRALPDKKPEERGGLNFPGTQTPGYIDFLYFSYVIGVASQTADVSTCSGSMRAVALAHGVVSFFYNTTILALMVNLASSFI
jgi:uncharacterized membrane protein